MEHCLLWARPHAGAEGDGEEEGASETMCKEQTAILIPHPPVLLKGEKAEKIRSEAGLGKKGGAAGKVF